LKLVYAQEFLTTANDAVTANGKKHPFSNKNIVEEFKLTLYSYVTSHYNQTQDSLLSLVKPMNVAPIGFVGSASSIAATPTTGHPANNAEDSDSDSDVDGLPNGAAAVAVAADSMPSTNIISNTTSAFAASTPTPSSTTTTPGGGNIPSQMKFFQLMRKRTEAVAYQHNIEEELDHYFKEDTVPFDANPEAYNILDWWKLNALRYPRLAMMAKHLLSIPLTVNCHGENICMNVIGKSIVYPIPACVKEIGTSPGAVKNMVSGQSWLETYKRYNWAIPILPKLSA
jgi:hypothetical protein